MGLITAYKLLLNEGVPVKDIKNYVDELNNYRKDEIVNYLYIWILKIRFSNCYENVNMTTNPRNYIGYINH
jgi:hypothetical protein